MQISFLPEKQTLLFTNCMNSNKIKLPRLLQEYTLLNLEKVLCFLICFQEHQVLFLCQESLQIISVTWVDINTQSGTTFPFKGTFKGCLHFQWSQHLDSCWHACPMWQTLRHDLNAKHGFQSGPMKNWPTQNLSIAVNKNFVFWFFFRPKDWLGKVSSFLPQWWHFVSCPAKDRNWRDDAQRWLSYSCFRVKFWSGFGRWALCNYLAKVVTCSLLVSDHIYSLILWMLRECLRYLKYGKMHLCYFL